MAKKLIIFVVVALVGGLLLTVGSVMFQGGAEQALAPTEENIDASSAMPVPDSDVPEMVVGSNEHVVVYGDGGFSPKELGPIAVGDKVIFRNESSRPVWPASDSHPTHMIYDGTSLKQHCNEGAALPFDSCRGIEPGGEWSFVFNKPGTWRYHDHLNASRTGTIVVE